jgi:hypothetical protein
MSALSLLARKQLASLTLWRLSTLAALVYGTITNYQTVRAMMQPIRLVAMDERGSFYSFNAGPFERETSLHAWTAHQAAIMLLSRNPNGSDFSDDVLDRAFSGLKDRKGVSCFDQVKASLGKDADQFLQQQIHQKFELGKLPGSNDDAIRELKCNESKAWVSVEGQVVRQGVFNGRPTQSSNPVKVFFEIIANDDVVHNGQYPMVVDAFQVQYLTPQTAPR